MVPGPGETPTGDEVVELRTATTRTYETDLAGVYVTRQWATPVNVDTGDGWEPIDPTLEPAGDDGYTNTADRVDVTVAATADDPQLATVELASGASVGFSLDDAAAVDADVDGDTAVFADALDGVDVALQSTAGGIKETLTLAAPDAPNEFTYHLAVDGLTAQAAPDGSIALVDAIGNAKATIPPGSMADAAGATSTAVTYTLSPDGVLVVTADPAWLADPARVYPVAVDPTLSVIADSDDTYVTQGADPIDRSTAASLEVGHDGTAANRAFLHFVGPATMADMNVMEADLSLWETGSGSCTPSPVDLYAATTAWTGATTQSWPGPTTATAPFATLTSAKGHDTTCAAGAVGVDITRQVDAWVHGETPSLGIALRARDETAAAQHKTFTSANNTPAPGQPDHRPVINILWSDPTTEGAPADPSGLAPEGRTDSLQPTFQATYVDAEGDDGYVVFFGYLADTGAFAGAIVSPTVASNTTATVTGYVPLDFPLTWRGLAVDATHGVVSRMSRHVELIHPSVAIVEPSADEVVEGDLTVAIEVDASITDASSVTVKADGTAIASTDPSGGEVVISTHDLAEGPRTLTASINGGVRNGAVSPTATVYVDNSDADADAYPRGPTLRRTLGVIDDVDVGGGQYLPRDPVDSGGGDCGWSEPLPDGNTLWLVCDATVNDQFVDTAAGLAPEDHPTRPVWRRGRFLGTPPACPTVDGVAPGAPFRWATGVASYPVPPSAGYGPHDDTMVVIFFHQGCRNSTYNLHPGDTGYYPGTAGVATYRYHYDTPVSELDGDGQEASTLTEAQVRTSTLWPGTIGDDANPLDRLQVMHGTGAVYVAPQSGETTGYLYAYGCKPGSIEPQIRNYGRCNVARAAVSVTDVAALGERATWTYWNGTGWTACAGTWTDTQLRNALATQRAMRLPNPRYTYEPILGGCPDGYPLPCPQAYRVPQHFEVTYSPQLSLFLAAHQIVFKQRHMSMVVRAASNPVGPWSDPLEVPIDCDGRTRERDDQTLLNCYQLAAHPQLSGTASGNIVFHYYDHFKGSWSAQNPDTTFQLASLRFVSVPVCVRSSNDATPVSYVVSRCLMTGPTDSGWAGGLSRLEAAAVVWRLGGYRWRTPNSASSVVPRRNRESVTYFLTSPKGFTTVWSTATALTDTTPTTRAELIRLLWRLAGAPSASYPIETLSDYDPDWGGQLQGALRWAYANGIVCDTSFQPQTTATRGTTAQWVYRHHAQARCDT